jgi:GxxExxY protein
MLIELEKNRLKVESEKPFKVHYHNHIVGDFSVDILVEDEIIIELKSVEQITKVHEVQLVNYLNGLHKDIGLLINFGPTGVALKRKYRKPMRQYKHDEPDTP